MAKKKRVVIGLLGSTLDGGYNDKRWERWRPTVALGRHDDLPVDRFEILYQERFERLAQIVNKDLQKVSTSSKVWLTKIQLADPWDFEEVYATLHDFVRGYRFDPDREEYLVHITTGTHVAQICLFLLTESRHIPAKLLQTSPPPPDVKHEPGTYHIIDLDLSKYDRLASRFEQEQRESVSFLKSGIETRNANFNELIEKIEQVSIRSRSPILLMGPTGAGKSQLVRRIFELKKSRSQVDGEFVEVNCATLRGDAAMSALFGHVKGAFTGAIAARPGLLKSATGGVLFLDEIGELGLDEQAMMLRALEEKRFLPVGSDREVGSDFQLIAGTNRDLQDNVKSGDFRDDLLARINLWTFHLPGLRDRREDIEPNLEYELRKFAEGQGINVTFNKEARRHFVDFAKSDEARWSGNFRDLNAAMTRMATLADGGRIRPSDVRDEVDRLQLQWRGVFEDTHAADNEILAEALGEERVSQLDRFDRVQLAEVLRVCRSASSLAEAGRELFAVSRAQKKQVNDSDRLRKYLAKFDLSWGEFKE